MLVYQRVFCSSHITFAKVPEMTRILLSSNPSLPRWGFQGDPSSMELDMDPVVEKVERCDMIFLYGYIIWINHDKPTISNGIQYN